MLLNQMDFLWIVGLGILGIWLLFGVKKSHILEVYHMLDGKNKKLIIALLAAFSVVLVFISSIVLNVEENVGKMSGKGFNDIINTLGEIVYKDNVYAYKMVQFCAFLLPAMLIFVLCVIKLLNWKGRQNFPVYFLFLFAIINKPMYIVEKEDWNTSILFLVIAVLLLVIENALQHRNFNKKMVLYMASLIVIVGVLGSWCGVKAIGYVTLAYLMMIVEIAILAWAVQYTQYLRIIWRRLLKVLYIAGICYINWKI